jgi:hypothetical protein
MPASLVVELQDIGDSVDDLLGGVTITSLLESEVVLGADAREEGDLFAAQSGHAPASAGREPDLLRPHQFTASAEEFAEEVRIAHANRVRVRGHDILSLPLPVSRRSGTQRGRDAR